METWWLGWTLPMPYLLGYAVVGLAGVVAVTRFIGFHRTEQQENEQGAGSGTDGRNPKWMVAVETSQIVLQSLVASYVTLLVLGIVDLQSSLNTVVRLGLVEVVPLGFGAAMANRLFGQSDGQEEKEMRFPKNVALFVVGALFIAATIAPTQEMELVSAHMGWLHHLLLVLLTLVLVYLFLFELDFRTRAPARPETGIRNSGPPFSSTSSPRERPSSCSPRSATSPAGRSRSSIKRPSSWRFPRHSGQPPPRWWSE